MKKKPMKKKMEEIFQEFLTISAHNNFKVQIENGANAEFSAPCNIRKVFLEIGNPTVGIILLPEYSPILHSHNSSIIFEPFKHANNKSIHLQAEKLLILQEFQSLASRSSNLLETFFERVNIDDIRYYERLKNGNILEINKSNLRLISGSEIIEKSLNSETKIVLSPINEQPRFGIEFDNSKEMSWYEVDSFSNLEEWILLLLYAIQNSSTQKEESKNNRQTSNMIKEGIDLYVAADKFYKSEEYSKAMEYFMKASKAGNIKGFRRIGDMYRLGMGVDKDYEKAMEYYLKAGEKGDSESLMIIGNFYLEGIGREINYDKAIEYYLESGVLGNSEALRRIGDVYLGDIYFGLGLKYKMTKLFKLDYSKAMEFYLKSEAGGNIEASFQIGLLYEYGKEKDIKKAIEYYKKSAERGYSLATKMIDKEDYEIIGGPFGGGRFGSVSKVREKRRGIEYALKIFYSEDSLQNMVIFLKEAEILSKCHYPTLLSLKGIGITHEYWMITEYCENKSVRSYINHLPKINENEENEGKDSEKEEERWNFTIKIIIIIGVALGMRYLHSLNITHRDLNPNNILLDSKLYPRICDFGYSKESFNLSAQNNTGGIGTPGYFAPEVFKNELYNAQKADVYSFGMTIYFILFQEDPFPQDVVLDPKQLASYLTSEREPPEISDKDFGKTLKKLMEECWDAKPNKRPSFKKIVEILLNEETQKEFKEFDTTYDEERIKDFLEFCSKKEESEKRMDITNETSFRLLDSFEDNSRTERSRIAINQVECIEYKYHGIKQNYEEAIKFFEETASEGNEYGNINLGYFYENGYGVVQDYSKAMEYYKKAAETGNDEALNEIGYLYYKGYGVEQDYWKTFEYFKKSADKGNEKALNNLGILYQNGYGVEQDFSKALEYYKKAEEKGNEEAINNIGSLYLFGQGVKQDYSKAMNYFNKSAEKGNDNSINNIGYLYETGKGVERDYSKAMEYYKKAAAKGNGNGLNNIGYLYYHGYGVEQDYSKALGFYKNAAGKRNSSALVHIADFYYYGKGVEQDYSKAMEYYLKAAEKGDFGALFYIGNLYYKGEEVEQDYSKAMEYYLKAAEKGNSDAQKQLEMINKNG